MMQQMFLGHSSSDNIMQSGQFYPMCAQKIFDSSADATPTIPSATCEIPMRRALSFDETNTTVLDGSETMSEIKTILDASKYTVNPNFKNSNTKISGFRIEHWPADMSSVLDYVEAYWDGTGFNLYDHACNVKSNLIYGLPSQVGSITSCNINGTNQSDPEDKVYINCSSHSTRNGTDNWASDGGDYVFLGVTDKHHNSTSSDSFDTQWADSEGIAWGISDSDGAPSSEQAPKDGISRRSETYDSLATNWQETTGANHSGTTVFGYFIIKGKLI